MASSWPLPGLSPTPLASTKGARKGLVGLVETGGRERLQSAGPGGSFVVGINN